MWFILLYLLLLAAGLFLLMSMQADRRIQLMDLINLHKIHQLEWHHRGHRHMIMLTTQSIAKPSRNRHIGIHKKNGIIIRHFWLDGKLHNTDSFDIQKLDWLSP